MIPVRLDTLVQSRQLLTARVEIEREIARSSDSPLKVQLLVQLAQLNWKDIGNGVQAREVYVAAIRMAGLFSDAEAARTQAYCYENVMHLSLSFDEYANWADNLKLLDPGNDIFRGQVDEVDRARDRGIPWADVMDNIASSGYNRNDAARDKGRYGQAASLYHLVLVNRKQLRLPREDWERIVYEYGALVLRLATDAERNARKVLKRAVDPKEYRFIVQDALPLVEQYAAQHPNEPNSQFLLGNMRQFISRSLEDWQAASAPDISGGSRTYGYRCRRCGKILSNPDRFCPDCGRGWARLAGVSGAAVGATLAAYLRARLWSGGSIIWTIALCIVSGYLGITIVSFLYGVWSMRIEAEPPTNLDSERSGMK